MQIIKSMQCKLENNLNPISRKKQKKHNASKRGHRMDRLIAIGKHSQHVH